MKKLFTIMGFIILICFSFFITNKTNNLMISKDNLMMTIQNESDKYYIKPLDGVINGNKFIPGISGVKVSTKNSYKAMKKYGIFSSSLIKYEEIYPSNRLKDNYDKYIISGNKEKKMVTLIFLIYKENNISELINILNAKEVKANLFVDGYWFEENKDIIPSLIQNNFVVGNLSYNGNYSDAAYIWMDTIIKKIGKQKKGYCYAKKENDENLKICTMNKNYTIMPNLILENNFLESIKKNLENGQIISLKVNNTLINELPIIINYIKSKGYEIGDLDELLSEKTKIISD